MKSFKLGVKLSRNEKKTNFIQKNLFSEKNFQISGKIFERSKKFSFTQKKVFLKKVFKLGVKLARITIEVPRFQFQKTDIFGPKAPPPQKK